MKTRGLRATDEPLRSARATRIGLSHGESIVMDGPFTETKELGAGFARCTRIRGNVRANAPNAFRMPLVAEKS
jgi:hypothetical protein